VNLCPFVGVYAGKNNDNQKIKGIANWCYILYIY